MEDFTRPKCNTCGGNLLPTKEEGVLECESCMNRYPLSQKKEIDIGLAQQLNSADNLRKLHHFDDAGEMYEDIIAQHPDEVLAYWGAFLSEYGVEYVPQEKQYLPICHRVSRIPATDSRYLAALCSHCKRESDRQVYRMKAQQVENIRYRTYELSRSREPYDVFVCHSGGLREARYVKQLCTALQEQGKRVFVPQPSGDPATQEAYIYSAVQSAACMFVVAESVASLEASQNTWSNFLGAFLPVPWNSVICVLGVAAGIALAIGGISVKYKNYRARIAADEKCEKDIADYTETMHNIFNDMQQYRRLYAEYDGKALTDRFFGQ